VHALNYNAATHSKIRMEFIIKNWALVLIAFVSEGDEEVKSFATQFAQAQALFQVLNTDPSLRGLVQALTERSVPTPQDETV